jgi:hypothetical protein
VLFSKDIVMVRGVIRVSLLTSLLCHEVFMDEKFWLDYERKVM